MAMTAAAPIQMPAVVAGPPMVGAKNAAPAATSSAKLRMRS